MFVRSVIVGVDAKLNGSAQTIDRVEDQIVSEYNRLYADSSGARRQAIVKKTQELDEELKSVGAGIRLIALKKQDSIGSYFLCSTRDSLQQLRQAYKSGTLKQVLENIFNILIQDDTEIRLKRIVWNKQQYRMSANYLNTSTGYVTNVLSASYS